MFYQPIASNLLRLPPNCYTTATQKYSLRLSPKEFSVFKLKRNEAANLKINSLAKEEFISLSISSKELSLVAEKNFIPNVKVEKIEKGWSVLYIDSEIPFDATGVLDAVIHPLRATKVSLLAISTFDSDFFFFKKENTELVCSTLIKAGFPLSRE